MIWSTKSLKRISEFLDPLAYKVQILFASEIVEDSDDPENPELYQHIIPLAFDEEGNDITDQVITSIHYNRIAAIIQVEEDEETEIISLITTEEEERE